MMLFWQVTSDAIRKAETNSFFVTSTMDEDFPYEISLIAELPGLSLFFRSGM